MTPRQNAKVGSGTLQTPHSKKARMSKSEIKSMLICFFDSQGIVHKEFVSPGQTVNQIFIGKSLKDSGKGWHCATRHCTHLDAAPRQRPRHTAVSINEFLEGKSNPVVPQPPIRRISIPVTSFYSPGSKTTRNGAILVLWIISRRA